MIVWTEQASRQLDHAYDHIARSNSDEVAARVTLQILRSIERLESFPLSGRPGRIKGTRELVIPQTPFIVGYTTDKKRIVILALYHGAQKWPDSL